MSLHQCKLEACRTGNNVFSVRNNACELKRCASSSNLQLTRNTEGWRTYRYSDDVVTEEFLTGLPVWAIAVICVLAVVVVIGIIDGIVVSLVDRKRRRHYMKQLKHGDIVEVQVIPGGPNEAFEPDDECFDQSCFRTRSRASRQRASIPAETKDPSVSEGAAPAHSRVEQLRKSSGSNSQSAIVPGSRRVEYLRQTSGVSSPSALLASKSARKISDVSSQSSNSIPGIAISMDPARGMKKTPLHESIVAEAAVGATGRHMWRTVSQASHLSKKGSPSQASGLNMIPRKGTSRQLSRDTASVQGSICGSTMGSIKEQPM